MSKGVMAGVGAGSVVAVLGLGLASLTLPPVPMPANDAAPALAAPEAAPKPAAPVTPAPVTPAPGLPAPAGSPETAIAVPAASEFARGGADQTPVPPMPAPAAPEGASVAPAAPVAVGEPTPAPAGTEPPARPMPSVDAPAPLATPETAQAALETAPEAEAPVGVPPPGEAAAPDLPQAEVAAAPEPALVEPEPAAPAAAPEPAPGTAAEAEEITLMPDGALVPPAALPRVFSVGEGNTGFAAAEGTRVNRLPQIGTAAQATAPEPAPSRLPQIAAAADPAPEADAPRAPALERFGAPFRATPGLPFVSVVLIDPGTDAGALDRDTLMALGLPVTLALDPARPDATEAEAAYRAAGFEVAILAQPLPAGAAPQDFEVTFAEWHRRLPEAVALVEPDQPALQSSAPLVKQAVHVLGAEGMAYVTQSLGVSGAAQVARGAGLPEASIWRVLDARRDKAEVIERTLARAAFEASRKGGVVVMLTAWPESVAGLQAWAPEAQGKVDLAPLSAAVLARAK